MLPSVDLLGPECDSDAGPKTVFLARSVTSAFRSRAELMKYSTKSHPTKAQLNK